MQQTSRQAGCFSFYNDRGMAIRNRYQKEDLLKQDTPWHRGDVRALFVTDHASDTELRALSVFLPELARLGINVLILEVNYNFAFSNFPKLQSSEKKISKKEAHAFTLKAKNLGISVVPLFQILGNQSEGLVTSPFLKEFPEFDTTPGMYTYNAGIHSREWDPLNEQIEPIIFSLLDELIDAFQPEAFHIGMGEIFLLGDKKSPTTHGRHVGVLYAYVANIYRHFLVYKRDLSVMMWGDRLIDGNTFNFGPWESSFNGTWEAVDLIPRDIIVCPWHYKPRREYPSVKMLLDKGFRVLPMCWSNLAATEDLITYCRSLQHPGLAGFIFSSWHVGIEELTSFKPILKGLEILTTATQAHPGEY